MRWREFETAQPDLATAGRQRLVGADGVAIAFLATVSTMGRPRMAPVCPIFCDADLYLSVGAHTPKANDLRRHGAYVLHAFLGDNDEEFQIAGFASEIADPQHRARVHSAIRFGAFKVADPIFQLDIDRALWVYWERVGQPDTKPIRRTFRSA